MHRNVLRRYLKHGLFPQLAVFEACARLGSFTRAADELSLAQPTVSCQIRKLSETLGTPLFDTSGKQAVLTPAGRELSFVCAEIFTSLAGLDERMETYRDTSPAMQSGKERTTLRVAVTTCTQYRLGAALTQLDSDRVEITLDIMNRQQLLDALPLRRHDLYLVENLPVFDGFRAEAVRPLEMILVAHRGHVLAEAADLTLADLAGQSWIAREEGSGPRAALMKQFASQDIALHVRHTLGSNEAIRQAVARKLGIALLPSEMFPSGAEAEGLVQLTVCGFPIRQTCSAVLPDGERQLPALSALLAALQ